MLNLKEIVQSVAEAMGPMKQRKEYEDEQIQSHDWMEDETVQCLVARRLKPTKRKR